MEDKTDLSHLVHLKELYIYEPVAINMLTLAAHLFNLNFLEVMYARWEDVLPFSQFE